MNAKSHITSTFEARNIHVGAMRSGSMLFKEFLKQTLKTSLFIFHLSVQCFLKSKKGLQRCTSKHAILYTHCLNPRKKIVINVTLFHYRIKALFNQNTDMIENKWLYVLLSFKWRYLPISKITEYLKFDNCLNPIM